MSKKYYRVEATMSTYVFVDVEAENEIEAREKAERIDGGLFIEENDSLGGWDITDCNEIPADKIQNLIDDQEEEEVA